MTVRTAKEWLTSLVLKLTERPTTPLPRSFPPTLPSLHPCFLCLDALSLSGQRPTHLSGLRSPSPHLAIPTPPLTLLCENPTHQSTSPKTPSRPVRLSVLHQDSGNQDPPRVGVGVSESPVLNLAQGWPTAGFVNAEFFVLKQEVLFKQQ